MDTMVQEILDSKLIAIVRGIAHDDCMKLAKAFYDGGIRFIEVTFAQNKPESFEETARSIRGILDTFGGEVRAGAGTVLNCEQVDIAAAAGAQYIISPDCNVDVIRYTKKLGLISIPGAMTASEILTAHDAGADFVKVFPAGVLGPEYVKAIRGPVSHVNLMAVGGVNDKNIPDFTKVGICGFGVGGNLVNQSWIRDNRFDLITQAAKDYVAAVKL